MVIKGGHLQSKKCHCKFTYINAYLRFFLVKNAMKFTKIYKKTSTLKTHVSYYHYNLWNVIYDTAPINKSVWMWCFCLENLTACLSQLCAFHNYVSFTFGWVSQLGFHIWMIRREGIVQLDVIFFFPKDVQWSCFCSCNTLW